MAPASNIYKHPVIQPYELCHFREEHLMLFLGAECAFISLYVQVLYIFLLSDQVQAWVVFFQERFLLSTSELFSHSEKMSRLERPQTSEIRNCARSRMISISLKYYVVLQNYFCFCSQICQMLLVLGTLSVFICTLLMRLWDFDNIAINLYLM